MFTNVMNEQKDKSYSRSDFDLSGKTLVSGGALKEALVSDMSIPSLKKVNMVSNVSNDNISNGMSAPSSENIFAGMSTAASEDITMKSDTNMPSEHVNKFVPEGSNVPNIPVINEMPMQEIVPEPQVTSETPLEVTSENKFTSPQVSEPVTTDTINPVINTIENVVNNIPEPQVQPEVSVPVDNNMFTPHIPVIEEQKEVNSSEEVKEPTIEPVMESVTSLDDVKLGQEENVQTKSITDDLQSGSFVDESGEVKSDETPLVEPISAPLEEVKKPIIQEEKETLSDSDLEEDMAHIESQVKSQEVVSGEENILDSIRGEHLRSIEALSSGISDLFKGYIDNMNIVYDKLEELILEKNKKYIKDKYDMENAMGMLSSEELDKAVDRWDGKINEAANYGVSAEESIITTNENTRAI